MNWISEDLPAVTVAICLAAACSGCSNQPANSTPPAPIVTTAKGDHQPATSSSKISALAEQATPETILTLSADAAKRLQHVIRTLRDKGRLKKDNAIVQIAVVEGNFFRLKNGGDKRYRYTLLFDDDPKDQASYFSMESHGVTVLVPKSSADYLRGTQVVWIESGGKGGLNFLNPNQINDTQDGQIVPVAEPEQREPSKGPTPINE